MSASDPTTLRNAWTKVLNTNIISICAVSEFFAPLLKNSESPRIVNVSSVRGSFSRVTEGSNPPTVNVAYSTSKAGLNMMTLGMAVQHPEIEFYLACPGHCKTAFNGFRGLKHPVEGGKAPAELALAARGKYEPGFWHWEEKGMEIVQW